jgi:WD40 repeat protein
MDIHNLLATRNNDTISLWSSVTYELTGTLRAESATTMAFSRDNTRLVAVSSTQNLIIIWDIASLTELARWETEGVSRVVFNAQNELITYHNNYDCQNGSICLWNPETQTTIKTTETSIYCPGSVMVCGYTKVILGWKSSIFVWDPDAGDESEIKFARELSAVSPRSMEGNDVAISFDSGRIIIYDIAAHEEKRELVAYGHRTLSVQFSQAGLRLYSFCREDGITCRDVESGEVITRIDCFSESRKALFWSMAISPDDASIAVVAAGTVTVAFLLLRGDITELVKQCTTVRYSNSPQVVLM